jgi:hypothetical protein
VFFCVCKCCPLQQLAKPVRNSRCDTHSTPNISLLDSHISTPTYSASHVHCCGRSYPLPPPILAKLWPSSTPFATAIPPRQVMLLVAGHALLAVLCCSTLCRCLPCCLLAMAMPCAAACRWRLLLLCVVLLCCWLGFCCCRFTLTVLLLSKRRRCLLVRRRLGLPPPSSERCFILELPPLPLP